MITVHFVPHGAAPLKVKCKTGRSLMQAATTAGVDGIVAECGGMMTCGTCHVYVREPQASLLPPTGPDELGMLEFVAAPRRPNSRLSCQIKLTQGTDGITVDLPESQY